MIRVVVADDHPIVREGIRRVLQGRADMSVVGEAADGGALLDLLARLPADVVVIDVSMPGPAFLDLLGELTRGWPKLRTLVLSMQPEETYAVRALRSGAHGFLAKSEAGTQLIDAVKRVASGRRYISAALAEALAAGLAPDSNGPAHERLSAREFAVLGLVGAGRSVKEIAASLEISPKTVSTYRARILEKLGLESTADLIRYAIEHEINP